LKTRALLLGSLFFHGSTALDNGGLGQPSHHWGF